MALTILNVPCFNPWILFFLYLFWTLTHMNWNEWKAVNLTQALLFLAHFIGDIHQVINEDLIFDLTKILLVMVIMRSKMNVMVQPLHVGFTSDRGGNNIDVHWYRTKTVLHHVSRSINPLIRTFFSSLRRSCVWSISYRRGTTALLKRQKKGSMSPT